ncbi:THUMP domain-containing protein, partial [Streptococcus suis]
ADYQDVSASLKKIFGIQNFAPSYKIEKSVPALKEAVVEIMQSIYKEGMTFKIAARRSDHSFELDSRDLNQVLGDAVFTAIPNVRVQMKSP